MLRALFALFLTIAFDFSGAQVPIKMWDSCFGGSKPDIVDGVVETPDNGIILAGVSASNYDGNKSQISQGYYDFWVVKADANGNLVWDKRFGESNDGAFDIQSTIDGNYIVGGYSQSAANGDKSENSHGNKDFWLVKINPSGDKMWDHCYGGKKGETLPGAKSTADGG